MDLIPIFIFLARGNPLITGQLADIVFFFCVHRQGRRVFFHIRTGKSKAAEKLSEAQKLLRQNGRNERKQAYSVPVLLKTTCICPPVVPQTSTHKESVPGGERRKKTNPENYLFKIETLKEHKETEQISRNERVPERIGLRRAHRTGRN